MSARQSLGTGLAALLYLAVPVLLVIMAWPRFTAGLAVMDVQPVVTDRMYARAIPPAALSAAAADFGAAVPSDGESRIWQAEMLAVLAKDDVARLRDIRTMLIDGLKNAPASTRGWTLLCEIDAKLDLSQGAACFDTAFYIGPYDWFVSRRRSELSAVLWPLLDQDTKDAAARRMKTMWDTQISDDYPMRNILYDVDKQASGPALLQAAFATDPDELRAFNRWLIRQWMYGEETDRSSPP
jgi:hypothetical protein